MKCSCGSNMGFAKAIGWYCLRGYECTAPFRFKGTALQPQKPTTRPTCPAPTPPPRGHACECGKDRRIADLERDGAKLQGLNQQLAARVAELEKSQEAGKAPACESPSKEEARLWVEVPQGVDSRALFGQIMRAIFNARIDYAAPIQLMRSWPPPYIAAAEAGKAPTCECQKRKALRQTAMLLPPHVPECSPGCIHDYVTAALSAPCPLEAERAEQWRARREAEGREMAARAACDSLRAKVEAVRSIADQARLSDRDLRGALEAIDRALNVQPQNTAPTETIGAADRAFPSKEKGNGNV